MGNIISSPNNMTKNRFFHGRHALFNVMHKVTIATPTRLVSVYCIYKLKSITFASILYLLVPGNVDFLPPDFCEKCKFSSTRVRIHISFPHRKLLFLSDNKNPYNTCSQGRSQIDILIRGGQINFFFFFF
jgi:hypothetical protein